MARSRNLYGASVARMSGYGARVFLASELSQALPSDAEPYTLSPGNTAAENAAAYAAWAGTTSGEFPNSTLVFDVPGTYQFPAETLAVPANRTLSGIRGGRFDNIFSAERAAILRCVTAGEWFVAPATANPIFLEHLVLEGGVDEMAPDGSVVSTTKNARYLVKSGGGSPATRVSVTAVFFKGAVRACVFGRGAILAIRSCTMQYSDLGVLLEGCTTSFIHALKGNDFNECFVRLVGSHAVGYEGGTPPNGGDAQLSAIIGAASQQGGVLPLGLELIGVAQCSVHGITIEGASTASIRVANKSTNVRVFGSRANGNGPVVVFDGCYNAFVWGGDGVDGVDILPARVRYLNDARGCRAFVASESVAGYFDVEQRWETPNQANWIANVRPDGTILSKTGGPPTAGFWEKGDLVFDAGAGAPMGWVCTAPGSASTWKAMPSLAP